MERRHEAREAEAALVEELDDDDEQHHGRRVRADDQPVDGHDAARHWPGAPERAA